ncbi:MAG: RagB/SusD family nutrient uptake outer membrane protein [Polaribacter sp.]
MKKLIYILFITLVFGMNSCSEDFLDKKPSYSSNSKNSMTNLSQAKAAIAGIYSTFKGDNWSGGLYVALASKSGFARWSPLAYNMEYTQLNTATIPTEGNVFWDAFYKSLNAANFAINGTIDLPEASVPSEAARKSVIAEGRCLRAWISTNILWNFGHWWAKDDADPYGILYRDQVVGLKNLQKARLSVGDSYKKIFEDLDYAIANLDSFTSSRYVSKEFAKVLKAKLLLYRGGYNDNTVALKKALTLVNEVLDASISGFSMQGDLAQVYKDSWDSKENLFVRYLDDDGNRSKEGGGYWYTYRLIDRGDRLPLPPNRELTAGLKYGADWFREDPRWGIVTGPVRGAETWNTTMYHIWSKVTRLGQYAGKIASPPDEKYAAYYFRYPELYIMKAELLARTGASIVDAIAPINTMHSKRTNPSLPALNPSTQQELMDMIFKEYFLETFLENGSEFFAALRFDTAGKPWIETIKNGKKLEENKICYPIPNAEMLNNPLMVQNPDLE